MTSAFLHFQSLLRRIGFNMIIPSTPLNQVVRDFQVSWRFTSVWHSLSWLGHFKGITPASSLTDRLGLAKATGNKQWLGFSRTFCLGSCSLPRHKAHFIDRFTGSQGFHAQFRSNGGGSCNSHGLNFGFLLDSCVYARFLVAVCIDY